MGGELILVHANFAFVRPELSIFLIEEMRRYGMGSASRFLSGTFRQEGDVLYYYIHPAYTERHGYETIIFHRIPDDEIDWEAMRDQLNLQ